MAQRAGRVLNTYILLDLRQSCLGHLPTNLLLQRLAGLEQYQRFDYPEIGERKTAPITAMRLQRLDQDGGVKVAAQA
jgi:hypothetical protein